MEPTLHINLGYVIAIFSVLTVISGVLLWIITRVIWVITKILALENSIKELAKLIETTDKSTLREIEQLKSDKVSIAAFNEFSSEIRHLTKSIDEIKNFIYNYKDK